MRQSTPRFVGLDVHKDSIAVAHAEGGTAAPPVCVAAIGSRQADLDQLSGASRQPTRRARAHDALNRANLPEQNRPVEKEHGAERLILRGSTGGVFLRDGSEDPPL